MDLVEKSSESRLSLDLGELALGWSFNYHESVRLHVKSKIFFALMSVFISSVPTVTHAENQPQARWHKASIFDDKLTPKSRLSQRSTPHSFSVDASRILTSPEHLDQRQIATTGADSSLCSSPFPPSLPGRLETYQPVSAICIGADRGQRIALRRLQTRGRSFLLTVHPLTLTTQFEPESCLRCQSATRSLWRQTPYGQALETSLAISPGSQGRLNLGLTRGLVPLRGSFLTADLCPSRAPFDRDAIQRIVLESGPPPVKMGLAYTGLWLQRHPKEFQWLRQLELQGQIKVEWINHSHTHPYRRGVDYNENFLLTEGVDLYREIFLAEQQLIEMGGRPSVFFRFPGLVGSSQLLQRLGDFGLIALGSEAWLAKGQRPRDGSLILLHANGNEPAGWRAFDRLWQARAIPLPFRDIRELVHPIQNP